jgi:vacuolar-type H+-ATPase subunit C/Vma6
MTDKFLIYLCIGLAMVFSSCGWNSKELTTEERYAVDTIYNKEIHALRAESDSLCLMMKDTFYNKAVDSLKKEYLREIELMLNTKLVE